MPISFNLPHFEKHITLGEGNVLYYDPQFVEFHELSDTSIVLVWGALWNCSVSELKSHFENQRLDLVSGDFLAVVIDKKENSFSLFCDLLGTRSIYYSNQKNQFSTRLLAMKGELNPIWWSDYFRGNDGIQENSPIVNIMRLKSDEFLKFKNTKFLVQNCSFSLKQEIESSLKKSGKKTVEQCLSDCGEILETNIKTILNKGDQSLLMGSVGVDSNSILALASDDTLSCGMKITVNQEYDVKKNLFLENMKSLKAREAIVFDFNENHFSQYFTRFLREMSRPMSNYWTFAIVEGNLFRRLRQFDLLMTGLGGDEVFFHRLHFFKSFSLFFSLPMPISEEDYLYLPSDDRFTWNGRYPIADWIEHSLKWNRGVYEHVELEFMTGQKVFSPFYDRRLMHNFLSLDPENLLLNMKDAGFQNLWIRNKSDKVKILPKRSNHFSPSRSFSVSENFSAEFDSALNFLKFHAPDILPHYQRVAQKALDKAEIDLESARLVVFGRAASCRF
ncbi:MAG: hypothetical protein OHK0056_23610 [Bacteriovoracaceae bacterium]